MRFAAFGAAIAGAFISSFCPAISSVKAAPATTASSYNWTGFYAGANLGYGWGQSNNDWNFAAETFFPPGTGTCPPIGNGFCANASSSDKLRGAIGGLQAGYNSQFGKWLIGFETDFQYSGQKSEGNFTNGFVNPLNNSPGYSSISGTYTAKLDWLGTFRARAGITADRLLFYATGGLAYGHVKFTGSATSTGFVGAVPDATCTGPGPEGSYCPLADFSTGETKVGWALGAGMEGALGNNWSVKLEYLYVDLGTARSSFATLPGCFGVPSGAVGAPIVTCSNVDAGTGIIDSRVTDNIVRIGLNYRFGGHVR